MIRLCQIFVCYATDNIDVYEKRMNIKIRYIKILI